MTSRKTSQPEAEERRNTTLLEETEAELERIKWRLAELEVEKKRLEAVEEHLLGVGAYLRSDDTPQEADADAGTSDLPPELVRVLTDGTLSQVRRAIAVVYYLRRSMSFTEIYEVLEPFGVAASTTKPKDRIRAGLWSEEKRNGRFGKRESGLYGFLNKAGREWFDEVIEKAGYKKKKPRRFKVRKITKRKEANSGP